MAKRFDRVLVREEKNRGPIHYGLRVNGNLSKVSGCGARFHWVAYAENTFVGVTCLDCLTRPNQRLLELPFGLIG